MEVLLVISQAFPLPVSYQKLDSGEGLGMRRAHRNFPPPVTCIDHILQAIENWKRGRAGDEALHSYMYVSSFDIASFPGSSPKPGNIDMQLSRLH